jgi:hypothetical protein
MTATTFHDQCSLLAELAKGRQVRFHDEAAWTAFSNDNEIGFLLSSIYSEKLIEGVANSAIQIVEGAYTMLCELLAVDPTKSFTSIEEIFAASPLPGLAISGANLSHEARESNSDNQHPASIVAELAPSTDALSRIDVEKVARLTGFDLETVRDAVNGDWLAQSDIGDKLLDTPEIETALTLLRESAYVGAPWAIATYTWHCLQTQQFARARDLFQVTANEYPMFVFLNSDDDETEFELKQEWANCRSNDALCALAMDEDEAYALEVWSEGAKTGHPESMFYPALIYWKAGKLKRASRHIQELDSEVLEDVLEILTDCAESAEGWFRSWCQDGLEMFAEITRIQEPAHGAPSPTQSFCGYCGARGRPDHSFCVSCGQTLV